MIPCKLPDNNLLSFNQKSPLIVTVAPVGSELSKKHTPYLPSTPDDILKEALVLDKLGVHVLHLHGRNTRGNSTLNPHIIGPLIKKIKKQTSLIIQISTGGSVTDSPSKRMGVVSTGAPMASLSLGSINFGDSVFLNSWPFIKKLALILKQKKIRPELEVFDAGMVDNACRLIDEGLLTPPYHFNILLGGSGWLAATEENLDFILKKLPPQSTWQASGVGKNQLCMITWALERGGHVRTGLEDNIYLQKGILAKGNACLVDQVLTLANKYNRPLASSKQAKIILGLVK